MMGIILLFNLGHNLTSCVALLNTVTDATTNVIVTLSDAVMVATAMARLQYQWDG